MNKTERLQRRLSIALQEAADADRVWRRTMELPVDLGDDRTVMLAARRAHAVWQEREHARARVTELRRRVEECHTTTRMTLLHSNVSFLGWQARRWRSSLPNR